MRLSSPLRRTSGHSGSGAATSRPNRAFVWTIEAARLLAGDGDAAALRLLKMAVKEIGQTMAARKGVIDLIDIVNARNPDFPKCMCLIMVADLLTEQVHHLERQCEPPF